jgi:hypothetical protein
MTEPEDFLSRWSRRKRETKADDEPKRDEPVATKATELDAADARETRESPPQSDGGKPDDIFDLSKLPSLDSIGPATDIRMFMQPGVPEALSRAALRRAWSADPAIRDFIGLSENSWDFTASDGMHGFGALDPVQAKRLLAQLLGESDDKAERTASGDETQTAGTGAEQARGDASDPDSAKAGNVDAVSHERAAGGTNEMLQAIDPAAVDAASQKECAEPEPATPIVRRVHGRALPQ